MKIFLSRLVINSSREYLDDFAKEAGLSLRSGAVVLDAGAGNCPYKQYFAGALYESADFCQVENKEYGAITYVCDLKTIPVADNRYDLIFCTQVLEHVPEPRKVLKEFYRILKPGGALWISAPFFYEEHEAPYDFYRYSQFGFAHLLTDAGFKVQRSQWLEGYFGTLSYQLTMAVRALPLNPKHYGGGIVGVLSTVLSILLKPLFFLLAMMFSHLDLRHKFTGRGQCKNYAIVAKK